MRTKRDVREWRSISENKIWDGVATKNEVLPALILSYDQLPSYMKQCFVFCATFPQDYEFEKETLIQLWMANDFIPKDDIINVEDKGEHIFNELCWRSFFQDIKYWGNFYTQIVTNCKMHDLMHDLAKHIAGEQCASMLEVESDKVFHLSVVNRPSSHNLNSILKEFPAIRTCLVNKGFTNNSDNEKHYDAIKNISLRALQMKKIEKLPKEFGYMKHLRYLDLSYGKFDSLPENVTTLYNLQTLNLSGSKISKLPERMRYMISLRHLFINGTNLKRMPTGFGQLRSLRILTTYMADYDSDRNIGQLNGLNLHQFLWLYGLENVRDKNEANAANMVSKINLFSLYLTWGSLENRGTVINDQEVLDGLRPSSEIKDLYINGYAAFDFPIWMKETLALRNLSALYFINCHKCTALPPIWHFPVLKCLHLKNLQSLIYIYSQQSIEDEESECLTIFPNLKSLVMSSLDNLEGWHKKDNKLLAFPQLDELSITSCPKIRSIPSAPLLRFLCVDKSREIKLLEISNLSMVASSMLTIVCESPTTTDVFKPTRNVVKMSVEGFENVIPLGKNDKESNQDLILQDLTIRNSNCFFSSGSCKQSLGFWTYFESLEILYICDCNALSFWPEQEFRSLKCLKKLHIDACDNFTGSSSIESFGGSSQASSSSMEPCREDILPHLETLIIEECPKLMEIPSCCKSLKTLTLEKCPSISKEGLNYLKNLRELRKLTLDDCAGLISLPDGLESLLSLKSLNISDCPGLEAFPRGLGQRLSTLQNLWIVGCPVLERRCRSGGDYHLSVSAIRPIPYWIISDP
jgi:Leucine-rich repeat (LRR) protein